MLQQLRVLAVATATRRPSTFSPTHLPAARGLATSVTLTSVLPRKAGEPVRPFSTTHALTDADESTLNAAKEILRDAGVCSETKSVLDKPVAELTPEECIKILRQAKEILKKYQDASAAKEGILQRHHLGIGTITDRPINTPTDKRDLAVAVEVHRRQQDQLTLFQKICYLLS